MPQDDVQYVADMGLITLDKPRRIANSINMEKRNSGTHWVPPPPSS